MGTKPASQRVNREVTTGKATNEIQGLCACIRHSCWEVGRCQDLGHVLFLPPARGVLETLAVREKELSLPRCPATPESRVEVAMQQKDPLPFYPSTASLLLWGRTGVRGKRELGKLFFFSLMVFCSEERGFLPSTPQIATRVHPPHPPPREQQRETDLTLLFRCCPQASE